jgi:hypothetical protein
MFFNGTMSKQLKYVGDEKDHPFLEQTYMHLALLFKTLRKLDNALVMWEALLEVHQ